MRGPKLAHRSTAPEIVRVTHVATSILTIDTAGRGFVDITSDAQAFVDRLEAKSGALTLFLRHTSASLTIQENADPDVCRDLLTALSRIAPESAPWKHDAEGPDDMPAHVKAMLTGVSLNVPVCEGALALGTWQAIYLIEHRARAHRRELMLQFIGCRRND